MAQQNIRVDAGTGSPVDFYETGNLNYRQVIAIGDSSVDAQYATVDANGDLHVKNTQATVQFTNGTIAISGTVQSTNSTITVSGDIASGASDSGKPVKVGYVARTTLPTAVSDAQRVNAVSDKYGRIIAMPFTVRELVGTNYTVITTTSETAIVLAQGANVFADLTDIIFVNTGGTFTVVSIRDTPAGAIKASFGVPTNDTRGAVWTTPFRQTTANNNWTAQLSATTTINITTKFIKEQ